MLDGGSLLEADARRITVPVSSLGTATSHIGRSEGRYVPKRINQKTRQMSLQVRENPCKLSISGMEFAHKVADLGDKIEWRLTKTGKTEEDWEYKDCNSEVAATLAEIRSST